VTMLTETRNYRLYFQALQNRPPTVAYSPLDLYIELTNHCNLRCRMCPNPSEMIRKRGFMEWNLFIRLLAHIQGKIKYLRLFLFGEATLHPEFIPFLKEAKDRGFSVLLDSNLVGVSSELLASLVDLQLNTLRISLDAVNNEQYRLIKGKDAYNQVMQAIRQLIDIRQEKGSVNPYLILQCIQMTENTSTINVFKEIYAHLGIDFINVVRYLNLKERVKQSNGAAKGDPSALCYQPWRHLAITWDGRVTPCCQDFDCKMELGRFPENDLFELWNGEKLKRIRSDLIEHSFSDLSSFCQNCNCLHGNLAGQSDLSFVTIYEILYPHRDLISPQVWQKIEQERRKISPF